MEKTKISVDMDRMTDEQAKQLLIMLKDGIIELETAIVQESPKDMLIRELGGLKGNFRAVERVKEPKQAKIEGFDEKIVNFITSRRKYSTPNSIFKKCLKRKGNCGNEARQTIHKAVLKYPKLVMVNEKKSLSGLVFRKYFRANGATSTKRTKRKRAYVVNPENQERQRKMMSYVGREASKMSKAQGIKYTDAVKEVFKKYNLIKGSQSLKI